MKPSSVMQFVLAAALASGTGSAQPLPDAKFLLAHSEDELKKHKTYQMEIEASSSVNGNTQPFTLASYFGSAPDRMRVESSSMTMVADGQYTWMYRPSNGQYVKRAAIGNALDSIIGSGMRTYLDKLRSGFTYKTLREDKLEIDGQVIDCWVIEMKAENGIPLPPGAPAISSSEFTGYTWIDKETGLVRQGTATTKIRLFNNGPLQSVETRTVYRSLKFDEPLPDSLFQFTPPAGAKEVPDMLNMLNLAGKAAPAFEIESLDGKPYHLSALRSKVILLDFWASWCVPCRQELPSMNNLYREFKGKDLLVIGVDVGEDRQTVEKFVKNAGLSYPVALTAGTDIAFDYHVTSYPTYVVIGRDGVVVGEQVGGRGEQAIRNLVSKAYSNDIAQTDTAAQLDTTQARAELPGLMRLRDDPAGRDVDMVAINSRLVQVWETLANRESVVVANNLFFLSAALARQGRLVEAEHTIQRSIAILERTYGPSSRSLELALYHLVSIEGRLGKSDLLREAQHRLSQIHPPSLDQDSFAPVGLVTAPRLISKREPVYSDKAKRARIQGQIRVALVVNTDGRPDDVAVILPLGDGLDEKAVEAVKAWRFEPGTKGGQPVRVRLDIFLEFRLL